MKTILLFITLLCLSVQASEKKTDKVCKSLEGNFKAMASQTIHKMRNISLNYKKFGTAIDTLSGLAPFTISCNAFTEYEGKVETCYSKCQAIDLDGQMIDMIIQYEKWRSKSSTGLLDDLFDVSHISFNSGL